MFLPRVATGFGSLENAAATEGVTVLKLIRWREKMVGPVLRDEQKGSHRWRNFGEVGRKLDRQPG